MKKKFYILFFICLISLLIPNTDNSGISNFLSLKSYAQENIKINSINFDNSDSIIFLGTSTNIANQEPNSISIEPTELLKINKKILSDPDRVFFDIENAIITFPNSTYELKNSKLKQVKIAQFSTAPNIVRIVIWNTPGYDTSQIKVFNIKNNIIIKLNNEIPIQHYLSQIYRETKESAVDYYDKVVVIPEEKPQITSEADEIFNQVQNAFKEEGQEIVRPNIEQKQARLKSRFFLEKVTPKNGNILLSGIGVINVEKPFTLKEPSRIIFDLPNTIVLQELRDKEFKISETESVKIGQFEPSKARIVIKTDNPELYKPIYSTNLQTLLIANEQKLSGINLGNSLSEVTFFKEQSVNENTNVVNIMFSNPVIYSIKRVTDKLQVTLYNISNFNTDSFNNSAQINKTGYTAKQISQNTYVLEFPLAYNVFADCYETLNAAQLRFVFTGIKNTQPEYKNPQITIEPQEKNQYNKKDSPFANLIERQYDKQYKKRKFFSKKNSFLLNKVKNKVIVIDAGHGGNDTGAMRGDILEKDITLAIALKVRNELLDRGLRNIILTRSYDKTLSLQDRVDISNNHHADIFVSIHINASVKSEINGIETHYYTEKGFEVARRMHKELMERINCEDRGLFKSKFYVINHTEAPAVLLELGFISNENERNLLISKERQKDSAEAIADGIINYLMEN